MAVSCLEQRLAPLTDSEPAYAPWGPLGVPPFIEEDLEQEEDKDATHRLPSPVGRRSRKCRTWAGYTPHNKDGIEQIMYGSPTAESFFLEGPPQQDAKEVKAEAEEAAEEPEVADTWQQRPAETLQQSAPQVLGSQAAPEAAPWYCPGAYNFDYQAPRTAGYGQAAFANYGMRPPYVPSPSTENGRYYAPPPVAPNVRGANFNGQIPDPAYVSFGEAGAGGLTTPYPVNRGSPQTSSDRFVGQSPTNAPWAAGSPPRGDTSVTTLMIQNLPRHINRRELLAQVDKRGFAGLYNFCHLPMAFDTRRNKGFAFLNFVSFEVAQSFTACFHDSLELGGEPLDKALRIVNAEVQGFRANAAKAQSKKMRRVRNANFKPVLAGLQ